MTESTKNEDHLEAFWEAVRGAPVPEPPDPDFDRLPGELVIGTSAHRVLVRILPNGQLRYGPEYTPEEAAEVFWTQMALKRQGMTERLQHLAIMEQMLVRIGQADLRTERLRIQAHSEEATEHDKFMAEMAMRNLESLVHQMIEFSRGLALRPQPLEENSEENRAPAEENPEGVDP